MDDFDKVFEQAEFEPQAEPVVETPADPIIEAQQPTPAAEQPPVVADAPTPDAPVEQPREDDGRFAPVKALQEERQKRQELERRLADIEARNTPPVPQPKAPDPYDDPQGFSAHQEQKFQQSLVQQRFQMSHEMAKQQFGADTVDAARTWAIERAARNPAFDLEMANQAHPLAWIVQQHKRDMIMSDIGEDPDAYVRRRAVELGIGAVPAPVAAVPVAAIPQLAPVVAPPRSLASAPTAGGAVKDVPTGPMSALDATFK